MTQRGGRKLMESRMISEIIMYILSIESEWKTLTREYGSPGSILRYFHTRDFRFF